MRKLMNMAMFLCILCGCTPDAGPGPDPAPAIIEVGESYNSVIDKLGPPNINSETQSSMVLIYDQIEIKLESNVVVKVYDHR